MIFLWNIQSFSLTNACSWSFDILAIAFELTQKWIDFKGECLFAHNKARAQHIDTPKLVWNSNLAMGAEAYARELSKLNEAPGSGYVIRHSQGAGVHYGENIYAGTDGGFSEQSIAIAMHYW